MFKKIRHIHFIGIGGIGMSGIAEVLLTLGYKVSGSDLKRSSVAMRLAKKGAKIYYGHKAANVENSHVVVVSSAVKASNPEWQRAQELGIPVIPRAEMLAELMRMKYGIAVAGSHGKTTTTSLIAHILHQAKLDPTMVIGGRVKSFRSNAKLGKGEFLVAEADESDGSFLKLNPSLAVITNIDPEHLDHYQSFEEIKKAFIAFANKIPFYGAVVLCFDHPAIQEILPQIKKRVVSYGLKEDKGPLDFSARNITHQALKTYYHLYFKGKFLAEVQLNQAGLHNVYNSLAAIAIAYELEIPLKQILKGLKTFKGIERRLENLFKGKEILIFDDYGHHPEEIKATLSALKHAYPERRLVTLFQPHRYTRTRDLFEDFSLAFGHTDILFMTEVYAAGEDPIEGVNGEKLANALKEKKSQEDVFYESKKDHLAKQVVKQVKPQDVILTLGAGDIVKVGKLLAQEFKKKETVKINYPPSLITHNS